MLDPELTAMMTQTVTHYPWVSDSVYGAPQYSATATTHPCRIVRRQRTVKDRTGKDVVSTSTVYIGPSSTGGLPGMTSRSKLVLSDGSDAGLIAVQAHVDPEDGSGHHEVAFCG